MYASNRIVTRLTPIWGLLNPAELLSSGQIILTNEGTIRIFYVVRVIYDESLTPLYQTGEKLSKEYIDINSLYKGYPQIYRDMIILDVDNYLMLYNK